MRGKRLLQTLRLYTISSAVKRTEYLKKKAVYGSIGDNCSIMSRKASIMPTQYMPAPIDMPIAAVAHMPAAVVNYYVPKCNLKLSAMYQLTGRYGHDTQLDRDNDDLGISTHAATIQLQYSF